MNNQSEHGIEARQPGAIETALTGGTRHMPALDGVRGLAILLVLIYHLLGTSDRATGWLVHNPIYGFLSEPLRQFFFKWFHPHAIGILLAAIVVAGISIAGAVLSYHLYEVHFLRLKRYFKERQVQALS